MDYEGAVTVAVPVPVDGMFDYALPAGERAEVGARVLVPYAGRRVVGVVTATKPAAAARGGAKSVIQVLDEAPVLPAALLEVVLRAARDALAPPGIALLAAIPPGTAPRPGLEVTLTPAGRRALERGEAPGVLGRVLWALAKKPLPESTLKKRFPAAVPALDRLERLGWLRRERITERPRVRVRTRRVYRLATVAAADPDAVIASLTRAKRQREIVETLRDGAAHTLPSSPSLRALVEAGHVRAEDVEVSRASLDDVMSKGGEAPELTPYQRDATAEITGAIREGRSTGFLLYGITGSGKTEVYLRATQVALEAGRSVIILVPEISLTHQVVDRFRERFGDAVAVLHSGLSDGERFDQWRRIRSGEVPIAIGARSAIFAPFEELGLVVIDEEHDAAYKSEEGFRYHARDVAELRAAAAGCPFVLGSATPDVGTAYRSSEGELVRLILPERVAQRPLPKVEIVDMAAERRLKGKRQILSQPLRRALAETLVAKNQAILFLNRRGFASQVYCFACGDAVHCKHCDISLVYHATEGARRRDDPTEGELRCHYCGHRERPTAICENCGSPDGKLLGFGTERLAEDVAAMYPHARVARLDRDTSARKGAQREILGAFHRHEIDVLVGTQMVAKGHDIPNVTLVGVVAADLGLHFPDFRSSERTFQLLAQVAGRAGRGEDPGRVVIQSFLPDHYAIALARTHDYPNFYREELRRREPHGYPPFRRLVHIAVVGRDPEKVERAALTLAGWAKTVPSANGGQGIEILGPAPAPVTKVRDQYRWQLLILGPRDRTPEIGRELAALARGQLKGVTLRLDANPLQML